MNAYWKARFQSRLEFSREGIADFIDTHILSLQLFYLEALEEGLDEDPAVVAWLHNKREALLLEALKEREVKPSSIRPTLRRAAITRTTCTSSWSHARP